ncbi:SAM-dependent methyltransferase [Paucibacter sp. KCTC 42545]|uniref:SAM-dependent methyltransferase n=1 Tax=Paucibacter sp. KCTC 42545 TaxID=1768242 RepID=UPI000733A53B|nr:SAM-dependent methyltransferase [Paucibacter sp. KCTC 42545]ALT76205.1 ribosomal RNA small subunit methyltransferase I [Paucibacter sp. KCTC 42545]
MKKGRLYLIPNSLDFGVEGAAVDLQAVLPLQVIQTAARLEHWAAENAKTTRALLKRVDAICPLAQPLQSLQVKELPRPPKGRAVDLVNQNQAWNALLAPALAGHDMGLNSEAGLPAVADPGALLVAAAHEADIEVVPMSGPSALLMALSASGLNGQSFAFVGYLPVEAPARTARIRELEALSVRQQQTQLMIETPYRNSALLHALLSSLKPQTRLSISCGLSLEQGWTRSATVAEWRSSGESMPDKIPAVFALLG